MSAARRARPSYDADDGYRSAICSTAPRRVSRRRIITISTLRAARLYRPPMTSSGLLIGEAYAQPRLNCRMPLPAIFLVFPRRKRPRRWLNYWLMI